jgi:hypothetical protein
LFGVIFALFVAGGSVATAEERRLAFMEETEYVPIGTIISVVKRTPLPLSIVWRPLHPFCRRRISSNSRGAPAHTHGRDGVLRQRCFPPH